MIREFVNTTKEAADYIGVNVHTVLRRAHKLNVGRRIGNEYKFNRDEVLKMKEVSNK